ncbi:Peroxidase, family 2-domain-containing protein [Lentinula raphanica]|nr:Peroxidase, family 2-domain-containing protein [Lentinula raphanica]
MLITFALITTLLASVSVVKSDDIDWSAHQWQAPSATDSRGPCPGLNTYDSLLFASFHLDLMYYEDWRTMAFYPGMEATSPFLLSSTRSMMGSTFVINILRIAAKLGLLTTDAEDSFSLEELALHGTLEHDASMSRNDLALGDNIHFNETVFTTLANSNPGVDYYNVTSAAQVLEQRLAEDKIVNPSLINTVKEFEVRVIESGFYLSVMGNVTTGVAPKNFVQILFREERLPLEEGWKRSEVPIGEDNFNNVVEGIANASTWAPSGEVVCPWIRLQPEGDVVVVEDQRTQNLSEHILTIS